jgi:transposase
LPSPDVPPDKVAALRRHHALNPRPQAVRDPAFSGGNPFFDANDLVQVKYEMLRRVREERQRVSEASASFGFSRPSFYEAQSAFEKSGLPGLLPQRPGPKRGHKLSGPVLDVLEAALAEDPTLNSTALARLVQERFGLSVHPRSVERALQRRRKGGLPPRA